MGLMAQFVPETDEAVKGEMIGAGSYAADQIRIQLTASFFSLSLFFRCAPFWGPCLTWTCPAVQSERKPAGDKKSESPSSLLTSANLFLRGDLSASAQNVPSPGKRLADSAETRAMEHVASGRTRANYIEAFGWNADLSTLASVVTSLATMRSEAFAGSGAMNNTSSPAPNVKMEEEDDSEDSASTNDDAAVANALHLAKENLISKAFDTMAKVRTSGFRLPDRAD